VWIFAELAYLRVRSWYRRQLESAQDQVKIFRDVEALTDKTPTVIEDPQDFVAALHQHQLLSVQTRAALAALTTEKIVKAATFYGIQLPDLSDAASWRDVGVPPRTHKALTRAAYASLRKQVLAARRESWDSYAKIGQGLVPLLGALTGFVVATFAAWHTFFTSK
jgi:hypothetical protein